MFLATAWATWHCMTPSATPSLFQMRFWEVLCRSRGELHLSLPPIDTLIPISRPSLGCETACPAFS